ncbi:MAG: hypothetical protein WBA17_09815 [Saprospiraceae bacterium]
MKATNPDARRFTLEIIWLIFTALLIVLLLLPVHLYLPAFPYLLPNAVAIFSAITLTRYLFQLDISWLGNRQGAKIVLVFLLLPLVFYLVQYINYFQLFFDERGPDVLIADLEPVWGKSLDDYLKTEFLFFSVWAVIAGAILPVRLIMHIWKQRNRRQGRHTE